MFSIYQCYLTISTKLLIKFKYMRKIISLFRKDMRKKIASVSLLSLLLNLMMIGSIIAPSENVALAEDEILTTGSITVCKMIIDEGGYVVDGSANAGTFLVPGISSIVMPDSNFSTSSVLNGSIINDDDARCILHNNLPLGSYWYHQATRLPLW